MRYEALQIDGLWFVMDYEQPNGVLRQCDCMEEALLVAHLFNNWWKSVLYFRPERKESA